MSGVPRGSYHIALFKIYSTRCPWKTWYTMKDMIQETRARWQSHAQRAQCTRVSTFFDSFCAILLLLKCIIYAYGCQYHFLYEPQAAPACITTGPKPVSAPYVISVSTSRPAGCHSHIWPLHLTDTNIPLRHSLSYPVYNNRPVLVRYLFRHFFRKKNIHWGFQFKIIHNHLHFAIGKFWDTVTFAVKRRAADRKNGT